MELPPFGRYTTGICFTDKASASACEQQFAQLAKEVGLEVVCWRDVPVDSTKIGLMARKSEPLMRQVFITGKAQDDELNRLVRAMVQTGKLGAAFEPATIPTPAPHDL